MTKTFGFLNYKAFNIIAVFKPLEEIASINGNGIKQIACTGIREVTSLKITTCMVSHATLIKGCAPGLRDVVVLGWGRGFGGSIAGQGLSAWLMKRAAADLSFEEIKEGRG